MSQDAISTNGVPGEYCIGSRSATYTSVSLVYSLPFSHLQSLKLTDRLLRTVPFLIYTYHQHS